MVNTLLQDQLRLMGLDDLGTPPSTASWPSILHLLDQLTTYQLVAHAFLEQTHDAVLTFDLFGQCVHANLQARMLFGVDLILDFTWPPERWLASADFPSFMNAYQKLIAGETVLPVKYRFCHTDGTQFCREISLNLIRDVSNQPQFVQYVLRDATTIQAPLYPEVKSHQGYESRLEVIQTAMTDVVSLVNSKGVVEYVSPSIERVVGYQADEWIGRSISEILESIHPDDVEVVQNTLQSAIGQSFESTYRIRYLHADGHYIWLDTAVHSTQDLDGTVSVVFVSRDITTQWAAEQALRDSEERLRLTFNVVRAGWWEWNVKTNALMWSDEVFSLLAYDIDPTIADLDHWMARIHPDDRAIVRTAIQQVKDGADGLDYEVRVVWPDGSVHWIHKIGHIVPDDVTGRCRVLGILIDATSRKQSETIQHDNERRLQLALQSAQAGYWESNLKHQRTIWSNQEYALMGRTRDQFTPGMDWWRVCVHPEDQFRVFESYTTSAINGVNSDLEYRVVWPDGTVHWLHDLSQAWYDESNVADRMIGISVDITARKLNELRIKAHEERLDLALTAAKAGWWEWNLTNQAVVYSAQAFKLMGYAEEIQPTLDQWLKCIHPDDWAKAYDKVSEAVFNHQICDFEYRAIWPDGSVHWLHNLSQVWYDQLDIPERMVGIVMDITARKQAEEALRQSEQRLRMITDTMSDSVGQIDTKGRLQYISPAFEKWTGIKTSEWINLSVEDLIGLVIADNQGQLLEQFSNVTQLNELVRVEHPVRAVDGRIMWFETVATMLYNDAGGFDGIIFVNRNIDERRQAEQSKLELESERKMVTTLRNVLANVSHDFRTPISAINSSLYLLRRKTPDDFQGLRHLTVIEQQLAHMSSMVESIFTLSHLEDEGYQMSQVELTELVSHIVLRYLDKAKEKHLRFNEIRGDSLYIMADSTLLGRAIDSIVYNALQYTMDGGTVIVRTYSREGVNIVEVKDSGIGIAPNDQPHIFESFYRGDKARNIDQGSTGVGLTIAQRIIQRHHGEIEFESQLGVGSTFRIILPAAL